ncbi:MAG TPA: MarR family transcriptional regulator [Conexibacter sp.]|jgi:DNA-binding MarR family transcriptional regulator
MKVEQVTTAQLAQELRETLGRVTRRVRADSGPPVAHLTVLSRLDRDGPASISELAAAERMRPQSMAQSVHDLQAAGFVSRRPDPSDKRRSFVELTDAGRETLRATRLRREGWLSETLDRVLDEHERERLHEALALLARVAEA